MILNQINLNWFFLQCQAIGYLGCPSKGHSSSVGTVECVWKSVFVCVLFVLVVKRGLLSCCQGSVSAEARALASGMRLLIRHSLTMSHKLNITIYYLLVSFDCASLQWPVTAHLIPSELHYLKFDYNNPKSRTPSFFPPPFYSAFSSNTIFHTSGTGRHESGSPGGGPGSFSGGEWQGRRPTGGCRWLCCG